MFERDESMKRDMDSVLVQELMVRRQPLINRRNEILDSAFFSLRPSLRSRLEAIDRELDEIDTALYRARQGERACLFQWPSKGDESMKSDMDSVRIDWDAENDVYRLHVPEGKDMVLGIDDLIDIKYEIQKILDSL
jgi:hypothetical protein